MEKSSKSTKGEVVQFQGEESESVVTRFIAEHKVDNNLLPDPEELRKYKEIDPDIVSWLKERAEEEQRFRHNAHNSKLKLAKKSERGERIVNYGGLFGALLLMLAGMILSYFLIDKGHKLIGSIFSTIFLIAIIRIFMSKVKSNNNKKS